MDSSKQKIPNYLIPAILSTVCCCLPFGIVAIIFAAQVDAKLAAGDRAGALEASNKAKLFTWIAVGLGLVGSILYIIFWVLATAARQSGL